jgi:hypothetical protein
MGSESGSIDAGIGRAEVLALRVGHSVHIIEVALRLRLQLLDLRLSALDLGLDPRSVLQNDHDVRRRDRKLNEHLELLLGHPPQLVESLLQPELQVGGGLLGRGHDRGAAAEDHDRAAALHVGHFG